MREGEPHTPAPRDLVLERLPAHPEVQVSGSQCGDISEGTTSKIGDASPFTFS